MIDKVEKKRLAILRVLKEAQRPLTGAVITEELIALGHEMSERTARYYFQALDQEGMTERLGKKKGRRITQRGLEELEMARVFEKVGFLSAKIDQLTYRMTFETSSKSGSVVVNMSVLHPEDVISNLPKILGLFSKGYTMGRLVCLFRPGERIGETVVPDGMVGLGTVCSVTLNGILLHQGIPTHSRFGGLLEIHDYKPERFVEIINYDGTSLDPLEIFIRSGMTNCAGVNADGHGRIGASFREFPAESRSHVTDVARQLERIGLGGFLLIGGPGRRLLEIPVGEGRVGAIVNGGLNPVALLEEIGVEVHSRALAGLVDFKRLFPYQLLEDNLGHFI